VRGGDPVRRSRLHGQVGAGRAGQDARGARFVRGSEPGSLPTGLRRDRSCLGDGTFTGNAPQAETHQHECVLVALPESGIARDTGLGRTDDTPHLFPAGLVLVHQSVLLGELPHTQSDRDDPCSAQRSPGRRGPAESPGMVEPVRLHALTARLDRRVAPVGPGLFAARRGTGAVLALRRRLPGHPGGHALLRRGAGSVPGKARLRLSEGDRALQHLVRWRGFPLGGRCRVFRQSAVLQGSRVRHVLRKRSGDGDGRAPQGPGARRFRQIRQAASLGLPRAVHGERGLVPILGLAGRIRAGTRGQARRGASRGEEPGRGLGPRGRAVPAAGTPAREGLHRRRRPDARPWGRAAGPLAGDRGGYGPVPGGTAYRARDDRSTLGPVPHPLRRQPGPARECG